jgi:hypothetical protein
MKMMMMMMMMMHIEMLMTNAMSNINELEGHGLFLIKKHDVNDEDETNFDEYIYVCMDRLWCFCLGTYLVTHLSLNTVFTLYYDL